MKLREYRMERSPKLMVIPMIDIIFFLLVFFMMSTLHMVYQKTLPVNLPLAAASQQDIDRPLAITLTREGKVYLEQDEVSLDLLRERLRRELTARPGLPIVLRAAETAEHGRVVAVVDELKLAGVQKLAIATEAKPR
ncbi:MAG: biopolymer transporter ExbD [Sporomusaceae bacterium]|nr:biopolymer transporter ExbD [Sporomusaceae bacterium]